MCINVWAVTTFILHTVECPYLLVRHPPGIAAAASTSDRESLVRDFMEDHTKTYTFLNLTGQLKRATGWRKLSFLLSFSGFPIHPPFPSPPFQPGNLIFLTTTFICVAQACRLPTRIALSDLSRTEGIHHSTMHINIDTTPGLSSAGNHTAAKQSLLPFQFKEIGSSPRLWS